MSFKKQKRKISKLLEKDFLTDKEIKEAEKMISNLKPSNEEEELEKIWLSEGLNLLDIIPLPSET